MAKKVNYELYDDRVLVKPAAAEEKTAGGIIIPDTAKEKPQKGTVVAVGRTHRLPPFFFRSYSYCSLLALIRAIRRAALQFSEHVNLSIRSARNSLPQASHT